MTIPVLVDDFDGLEFWTREHAPPKERPAPEAIRKQLASQPKSE